MTRTFPLEFRPPQDSPVAGPDVQLTVQEIEDAGLREVLQTPGAAFGSWAFLETLLQPGTPFVFREPLGQAREVKVALSGLFGRFVARAYLQRYFDLSVFAHLGRQPIVLDGERQIKIVGRARGDLPDWVACTHSLSNLTVAEAKGCHDPSGPARALDRAWKQAERAVPPPAPFIRTSFRAVPLFISTTPRATRLPPNWWWTSRAIWRSPRTAL